MKENNKWRVSTQKNGQVKSEPMTKRSQISPPPPAKIEAIEKPRQVPTKK